MSYVSFTQYIYSSQPQYLNKVVPIYCDINLPLYTLSVMVRTAILTILSEWLKNLIASVYKGKSSDCCNKEHTTIIYFDKEHIVVEKVHTFDSLYLKLLCNSTAKSRSSSLVKLVTILSKFHPKVDFYHCPIDSFM